LLSQLAEANCPVLLFSGGEPLLRSDLFELLAEAKRLALRAVISSNGTLIDSPTAKRLADLGVHYVGISIDGQEKFHDEFRQVKGCFKAAVAGIENCRKAGIKTGLRFTITKANAEQVPFVFDIAASIGVRRICFYHLIRMGRAKALYSSCVMRDASCEKNTQYAIRNTQYVMTSQQTRQVLDVIIERTGDFTRRGLIDEVLTVGNHADGPYLLVKMRKDKNQTFQKAGELLLANGGNKVGEKIGCVSWNGDVYADQFWRNYSLGNIRDKTFKEIWEDLTEPVLNKLRNKSEFADARCLRCKWFDLCKGNFRFLGAEADDEYWLNEPACYLTDEEIEI
jgi:radical SAM protein with 4Fe4S-binding SPASM domain